MRKHFNTVMLCAGLILVLWLSVHFGFMGNMGLPFGYYGGYNDAARAIERTGCVESMKSYLHEDLSLEAFTIELRTVSSREIRLRFTSSMNAKEVCNKPKGILIAHPVKDWQIYDIEGLSALLKEQGQQIRNIRDVLCNIEQLAPIFERNYSDENTPRTSYRTEGFRQYLDIEILHKK